MGKLHKGLCGSSGSYIKKKKKKHLEGGELGRSDATRSLFEHSQY